MTTTTMTCTECLSLVATADLAELTTAAAVTEHCGTCVGCATVVDEVSRETRVLADTLDGTRPGVPSQVVALRAVARSTIRARRAKRLRTALGGLGILAVPLLAARMMVSSSSTAPALEERTVELKCLAPDQAAELARPGFPSTVAILVRPVRLPIVTLKGPPGDLVTAGQMIERLDTRWGAERPEYCSVIPRSSASESKPK